MYCCIKMIKEFKVCGMSTPQDRFSEKNFLEKTMNSAKLNVLTIY